MKSLPVTVAAASGLALLLLSGGAAFAQESAATPADAPAPVAAPAGVTATATVAAPAQALPAQAVVQYEATAAAPAPVVQYQAGPVEPLPAGSAVARGQWVSTAENGWIWVPENATTYSVNQVPYVYLYTPTYGWTWYTSPWGPGRYTYGTWVSRPWNNGFRAWSHSPTGWGWHYGARPSGRVYAPSAHVVVARPVVRTHVFVGGRIGGRVYSHHR